MTDEATLISQLVDAQRNGHRKVDPTPYAALDRAAAYRIQHGVLTAVGNPPVMYKTAVTPEGIANVAPITATHVGTSGSFRFSSPHFIGLEVEVAAVLGKDIADGASEADVRAAIDHFILGIEICGTRYTDRDAAGFFGGLADNMSALGYVKAAAPRAAGTDIDGLDVTLSLDGTPFYDKPARHGFGSVLASLVAYAKDQQPGLPLRAGLTVTTGSLCGLVPAPGTGRIRAALGQDAIEFDLA